ncbi:DUF4232 domain-containing protein [Specibacter sp. AOP5-B1-6]|uniref:DUF4232 domain-containing protein n=1 Tax=Specibacter sp. AOP5-B1-6 TaxID=3457653 RepID=UPI00402BE8B1
MAVGDRIGRAGLAVLLLAALVLSLSGCLGASSSASDSGAEAGSPTLPAEVQQAGTAMVELALTADNVTDVQANYASPADGTTNGMVGSPRALWEIALTVKLAAGVSTPAALVTARTVGNHVMRWSEEYRLVVTLENNDGSVSAVTHQSRPTVDTLGDNFSQTSYFSDAVDYRGYPGVRSAAIDGSGHASVRMHDVDQLPPTMAALQLKRLPEIVLSAGSATATLDLAGGWLGPEALDLIGTLAGTQPVKSLEVRKPFRSTELALSLSLETGTREDAQSIEQLIKTTPIHREHNEDVLGSYVVNYGEAEADIHGDRTRPSLSGQLNYSAAQSGEAAHPGEAEESDTPATDPGATPQAPGGSPECRTDQVSGAVEGRVEAGLGHRAMKLVLSNLSETSCSVRGYPTVTFQAPDGTDMPVTLVNGSSYMFSDPGPATIILAPGGTAWAMLHWGANSTSQGLTLPKFIAVAPAGNGDFTARTELYDVPDIIDGSEIKVSAWSWPNAEAFR